MSGSIPGLYPLGARHPSSQLWTSKMCKDFDSRSLSEEKRVTLVEKHWTVEATFTFFVGGPWPRLTNQMIPHCSLLPLISMWGYMSSSQGPISILGFLVGRILKKALEEWESLILKYLHSWFWSCQWSSEVVGRKEMKPIHRSANMRRESRHEALW